AIRSPMSAAAQPPTRGDCRDSGSPSVSQLLRLFPPPAFGERRHRRLTGCRVAVRRVEVPVIAIGECPEPWRASRRGDSFHDAPNRCTLSEYVIVIVAPVALWAARGGTLKDKLIAAAHRHLFLPQILFRPAFVQKRSGGRITQRVKIEMEILTVAQDPEDRRCRTSAHRRFRPYRHEEYGAGLSHRARAPTHHRAAFQCLQEWHGNGPDGNRFRCSNRTVHGDPLVRCKCRDLGLCVA